MDTSRELRVAGMLVSAVLAAAACTADDPSDFGNGLDVEAETESPAIFPSDDWVTADPEELGFDSATLGQIAAEAEQEGSATCLVVARHGQIVGEWYWNGFSPTATHQLLSQTKSYSSTLVGIAQDEGHLDIDQQASAYIPEWVGSPSEDVTIRNILNNDSGRHSSGAGADMSLIAELFASPDRTALVIGLEQDEPPGTVWSNNEAAIQSLDAVLENATGQQPAAYAKEKLFDPIGARSSQMVTDAAGNTAMAFNLETTCRDAARFGHLFLNQGNWDGTQVVSKKWVAEATKPSPLNPGYGLLWWLNRPGSLMSAGDLTGLPTETPSDQQLVPGAPEDMYWALGAGGGLIQVHPSTDTVVVRFGVGDDAFNTQLAARVITEALRER